MMKLELLNALVGIGWKDYFFIHPWTTLGTVARVPLIQQSGSSREAKCAYRSCSGAYVSRSTRL